MSDFVHLHVHTEYSLLDGASRIPDLMRRARALGMRAIALSDHGNLFAVPRFYNEAHQAGLKPIIGCEFYLAEGEGFSRNRNSYHLLVLAKNAQGWENLVRLSSLSFLEGFYYKPRIHRDLLMQYKEGLIVTTGCLASEINTKILEGEIEEAERRFLWYLEAFGEDFYVELQDHGLRDQHITSQYLLQWAKRYGVKIIATNDVHYTCREDANLHDILLAVQTGTDYNDPERLRFTDDKRRLNPNFYLKSAEEMLEMSLFREYPESLKHTCEVAEKCELTLNFKRSLILPAYPIPEGFESMDAYLRHLAYEGARQRYPEITPEIQERLEHELKIIQQMGFAGYFLIVQDFVAEARRRGVWVGPGRGSAAGSLVAYVLGITGVDPLAYQLLFERFLNPERISPPDIDIDFDDAGREEVIRYVQQKYGKENVAQIITYGTMGVKTAIRDIGRVLKIPLSEVNRLASLIPNKPNITWEEALSPEENPKAPILNEILEQGSSALKELLEYARKLEGITRHTGVHAAGVIIAPESLQKFLPLAIATRDEEQRQIITQWDGPECESIGLLKMDFLGLKTLSILKTAVELIQKMEGTEKPIDLEKIPLDDEATWRLFQEGDTVGIFQFESEGMQKYLRMLRPTCMEDLIAMNALYRPGPMDNIPAFVRRKHGEEPITYLDPRLKPILENTYGIMVYQEQIMQIAQVMAGYSLAEADLLRRAMGKKKKEIMDEQRSIFVERAVANNTPREVAEELFDTMARFAEYGFNKSHAVAYSILAYRTAYLKANYKAPYMAAVLTHHADDAERVGFFLQEARRMGLEILPPCVNKSDVHFSVASPTQIRFGLAAIRHLGEKMAALIVEERKKHGDYKDLFDFVRRLYPYGLNKRALEGLGYAGALDALVGGRREYIEVNQQILLDYAAAVHKMKSSKQLSLFDNVAPQEMPKPILREPTRTLSLPERLRQEREYIGFFLSSHPLDAYVLRLEKAGIVSDASLIINQESPAQKLVQAAALLMDIDERRTKQGRPYARVSFEDKAGSFTLTVFSGKWEEWASRLQGHIGEPFFIRAEWIQRPEGGEEWQLLEVIDLQTAIQKCFESLYEAVFLKWDIHQISREALEEIQALIEAYPGKIPVYFILHEGGRHGLLMETAWRIAYDPILIEELSNLGITFHAEAASRV